MAYLLSSATDPEAYRPKFFHVLLHAVVLNGGRIDEIGDFKSCGVLMPPGKDVGNPWTWTQAGFIGVLLKLGISGIAKMVKEIEPLKDRAKAKVLRKDEKYYYIFFLGTSKEARGKGHCSKIVREYQEVARNENLPIWIEAGTEYCMRLYERLGFVQVDELLMGKGKCDKDGKMKVGGEGVTIWGMIWRPEVLGRPISGTLSHEGYVKK